MASKEPWDIDASATPEDLNEATSWAITYYHERTYDDIWMCFIEDFESWTEALFNQVDRDLARCLRDTLRQRGVFVKGGNIAAALNEALLSEDEPVWRDEDLYDEDLPETLVAKEALTSERFPDKALPNEALVTLDLPQAPVLSTLAGSSALSFPQEVKGIPSFPAAQPAADPSSAEPTTAYNIPDLDSATASQLDEGITWAINYYNKRTYDDREKDHYEIWGYFVEDFRVWDEVAFNRVNRDLARGLRDILRQHGVFVRRGNIAAALNEALISEDFPVWRDDDLDDDDLPDDDECREALIPETWTPEDLTSEGFPDKVLPNEAPVKEALVVNEALTPEALIPDTFVPEDIPASYDRYDDFNDAKERTPQKVVPTRAYRSPIEVLYRAYESRYKSPVKSLNKDLNTLTETTTIRIQIEGTINTPNEAIEWKKRWIWQPGITPAITSGGTTAISWIGREN